MLIFASAGSHSAAAGRVVDTLVGTAAGLAGGLIFGKPRVQSAREAVGTLAGRLADLLSQMGTDLSRCAAGDAAPESVNGWLTQARALRDEIERVDDTLRQAADSVRLNPRSRLGPGRRSPGSPAAPGSLLVTEVALRGGVETLELATVTVRGLARSVLDATGIDSDSSPVRDEATRARLAAVLGQLAAAIRTYGQLLQLFPEQSEPLQCAADRAAGGGAPGPGRAGDAARAAHPGRRRQQRVAAAGRDPESRGPAAHRPGAGRRAPGRADPAAAPAAAPGDRGCPRAARPGPARPARRDGPGATGRAVRRAVGRARRGARPAAARGPGTGPGGRRATRCGRGSRPRGRGSPSPPCCRGRRP